MTHDERTAQAIEGLNSFVLNNGNTQGAYCQMSTSPVVGGGEFIGCPFGVGINNCTECVAAYARDHIIELEQQLADARTWRRKVAIDAGHVRLLRCRDCAHFNGNKEMGTQGRMVYMNTCQANPHMRHTIPSGMACKYFEAKEGA